jgi:hypothetical protein
VALAVRAAVVTFTHELLVELFRTAGELAPALLQRCAGVTIDHARVEQGSIDLSQVASTEYRADAVVVLRDRDDAIVAAVIVEVQLAIDRRKQRTWPVYVTALHHKLGCPVILFIVTPNSDVAVWARRPLDLGHPGFSLAPLVLDFGDVPRIVDPAEVRTLPELGVLSAIANPDLEVAAVALSTFSVLPEDRARLYLDVILAALPPHLRKALETMRGYEYQSEFARKYYFQGHDEGMAKGLEEGRSKGLEEGRSKGLEEGRLRGLRSAAVALVRAKLSSASGDEAAIEAASEAASEAAIEATIEAMNDEHALDRLIGELARASDEVAVRSALARVR